MVQCTHGQADEGGDLADGAFAGGHGGLRWVGNGGIDGVDARRMFRPHAASGSSAIVRPAAHAGAPRTG